jgi:hypothetical protein
VHDGAEGAQAGLIYPRECSKDGRWRLDGDSVDGNFGKHRPDAREEEDEGDAANTLDPLVSEIEHGPRCQPETERECGRARGVGPTLGSAQDAN